jgi:GR25 family glycosyltransferase involved in LPS biosynthesis
VKPVKLSDITSVQIINLDMSKDRRAAYEKMLHDNFGDEFLGHKIGDEIRFRAVNGKEDVIFENFYTGKKYTYQDSLKSGNELLFHTGTFKIYSKYNPSVYLTFDASEYSEKYDIRYANKAGCHLSILNTIVNISKQKEGTYGMIFEDDFLVDKDFYKKMEKMLTKAPKDFDLIKCSLNQHDILKKGWKEYSFFKPFENGKRYRHMAIKSYKKAGYGDFLNFAYAGQQNYFIGKPHLFAGNQCMLLSQSGAKKIVEYYKNHLHWIQGNDVEFYYMMPRHNKKMNVYLYNKEVPVLLRKADAVNSNIVEKTVSK